MLDRHFCYWGWNSLGETVNFISDNFYDIGEIVEYKGGKVTIYDYAEEVTYDEAE